MAAPAGPRWPDREEKEEGGEVNTKQTPRRDVRVVRSARPPPSAEGKELRARCPGAARGRAGPYQPVARAAPRSAPR